MNKELLEQVKKSYKKAFKGAKKHTEDHWNCRACVEEDETEKDLWVPEAVLNAKVEAAYLQGRTDERGEKGELRVSNFRCSAHGRINPEPICPKCRLSQK